ncbi:MAG TPA: PTS sugar transporter subunit IIA [Pseudolysinimonas sp.]|nr:PTS sugar transporter subunit IIA [Pseudolysinimonas sp.]
MSLPPVPDDAVQLGAVATGWRDAVALAGESLARTGAADVGYAVEMIRMIEEHGPYIVIAPGLALAHARPGPDVHADGLSVVTLATPVDFGHPYNDPVRVVLGLSVVSGEHLSIVASIANVFNDSDAVAELVAATTPDAVREILGATAE